MISNMYMNCLSIFLAPTKFVSCFHTTRFPFSLPILYLRHIPRSPKLYSHFMSMMERIQNYIYAVITDLQSYWTYSIFIDDPYHVFVRVSSSRESRSMALHVYCIYWPIILPCLLCINQDCIVVAISIIILSPPSPSLPRLPVLKRASDVLRRELNELRCRESWLQHQQQLIQEPLSTLGCEEAPQPWEAPHLNGDTVSEGRRHG